YERYVIDRRRGKFEMIPSFLRRHLLLRFGRALPPGAYGKRYLSVNSLDAGPRYVSSISYFSREARKSLFSEEFLAALNGYSPESAFERIFEEPVSSARLDRQMYRAGKTNLPAEIRAKVDRISRAHSIEPRSPLLDPRLIEFAQTIPASLKLARSNRRWESKYILKRAAAGLIPDEIRRRS